MHLVVGRRYAVARLLAAGCALLLALPVSGRVWAEPLRVAVASNFAGTMRAIADRFERQASDRVVLSSGSTGRHYAQIVNGAPFDLFLAADAERPRLLEEAGLAIPGSRFTYALGRLVLWSPRASYVDVAGDVLRQGPFRHLAIANPALAPYGRAARQVLQGSGLWARLEDRLVMGENVAQAYQFVASGNAELGFVSASQLGPNGVSGGSAWFPDQGLYDPIEQQVVGLTDAPAARALLAYLRGDEAAAIIRANGYLVPAPGTAARAE